MGRFLEYLKNGRYVASRQAELGWTAIRHGVGSGTV